MHLDIERVRHKQTHDRGIRILTYIENHLPYSPLYNNITCKQVKVSPNKADPTSMKRPVSSLKNYDFCEYVKFGLIAWNLTITP